MVHKAIIFNRLQIFNESQKKIVSFQHLSLYKETLGNS